MKTWNEIIESCPCLYKGGMYFECGEGWSDIIYDLSMKLEDILKKTGDENSAVQVKEKYGQLRFMMFDYTEDIIKLIVDAHVLSSEICELCGKPGRLRSDLPWICVRCETCYTRIKQGDNQMTTPQNELDTIAGTLNEIRNMLIPDDEDSIMHRLDCIEEEIQKISRMQDQLALIIKLLGKNE